MKKLLVLTIGVMTAVNAASAIPIFATVGYLGGSGSNVTYKWNNSTGGLQTGIGASPSSVAVDFQFLSGAGGVPVALQGHNNAHMTITGGPSGNVQTLGNMLVQPVTGSLQITLDTPYLGQNLLLAVTFTGELSGRIGSSTAIQDSETILADTVVYSSDFRTFGASASSMTFTFLNVAPVLAVGPGNVLRSFNASGSGDFLTGVPEPSGLILAGAGCALLLIGGIRRKVRS
jgi:hypothetical protein